MLKGVLPMVVLACLQEEPTYGYDLVTRLTEAGLEVATGTVYPLLARLEADGQVTTHLVTSSAGPARKYYTLTPSGRQAYQDALARWAHLTGTVHQIVEKEHHS
jgi:PadR family transcriptional regulator PadR